MLQASDRVSFLPSVLKVTIVEFVIKSGVDLGEVATFLKSSKIVFKAFDLTFFTLITDLFNASILFETPPQFHYHAEQNIKFSGMTLTI